MDIYNRDTKKLISINIDIICFEDALNQIISFAKNKFNGFICFANVHMIIEAYRFNNFSKQLSKACMIFSDGVPIAKSLFWLYGIRQDRIAGMDVMPILLKICELNGLGVYFFGTTNELLHKIKNKALIEYPKLKISGLLAPPFNSSLDDNSYIDQINLSGTDLVFVSLGCPKQEIWMAKHYDKINALLLGVGGAFPVYAGIVNRAPLAIQNLGLEWCYRLYQEPKRLFKRYLITNTIFIYLVSKLFLNKYIKF